MYTQSNRSSALAATAAVHVALAALLLAGWQITEQRERAKPMIVTNRPAPVIKPDIVPPRTTEQRIYADLPMPDWRVATPEPEIAPANEGVPPGPAAGTGIDAGDIAPPQPPLPPSGPTRAAKLLRAAEMQPPYPSASRAIGEEGFVLLSVGIDARGVVTSVDVARSSGFPRLDAAAVAFALKRWRFEPALEAGEAVATSRTIRVVFSLENGR